MNLIFDVANWAEVRLKFLVNREYDLGKFLFTVAAGTIGFLFTAEKLDPAAKLEWRLILSFLLLLGAIASSVRMAMAAPPDVADAQSLRTIDQRTKKKLGWWMAMWVTGTVLGVWAVLPDPVPPSS
jgi:hypothetical protein